VAADPHAAARLELARACRVLAHRHLSDDILGHVSLRIDDDHLLVRCRGPHERGLRFTEPGDIGLVDLDGRPAQPSGQSRVAQASGHSPPMPEGYRPPNELPLHTEILRRRTDVQSVVHAHPRAVVAATLAGLPLLPMAGAFDIPAARLAERGIGRYPRAVLVNRPELGRDVAEALGDGQACVLHGHGVVTVGSSVAGAVLAALAVDSLARLALAVAGAGGHPASIAPEDLAELPDLGPAFNEATLWRHHLACLAADGWDLRDADGVGELER
jgi:3,4-dihydroxyphthalate decarboxylase